MSVIKSRLDINMHVKSVEKTRGKRNMERTTLEFMFKVYHPSNLTELEV